MLEVIKTFHSVGCVRTVIVVGGVTVIACFVPMMSYAVFFCFLSDGYERGENWKLSCHMECQSMPKGSTCLLAFRAVDFFSLFFTPLKKSSRRKKSVRLLLLMTRLCKYFAMLRQSEDFPHIPFHLSWLLFDCDRLLLLSFFRCLDFFPLSILLGFGNRYRYRRRRQTETLLRFSPPTARSSTLSLNLVWSERGARKNVFRCLIFAALCSVEIGGFDFETN